MPMIGASDNTNTVPNVASDAVLVVSEEIPKDAKVVKGYDFSSGVDHKQLLESFLTTGYQATNLGQAIETIRAMVSLTIPLTQIYIQCCRFDN